jgi:hypothetical protein
VKGGVDVTLPTTGSENVQQKETKRSGLFKGSGQSVNSNNSVVIKNNRVKSSINNGNANVVNGQKLASKSARPLISTNLPVSQDKNKVSGDKSDDNASKVSSESGGNCDINVNVSLKTKVSSGNLLTVPTMSDRFNDDIFVNEGFDEDLPIPTTNEHVDHLSSTKEVRECLGVSKIGI